LQAGTIRGFLNDGSTDYKSHHSVDSLAFGHCAYSYRNLGRLSRLNIHQNDQNFQVTIDGNLCFESTRIRLPVGYYFGITAVSSENPDSFEVNRLVVTMETYSFNGQQQGQSSRDTDPGNTGEANQAPIFSDSAPAIEDPPEIDANRVDVTKQFADLHNRLQAIMKHVTALHREYTTGRQDEETKLKAIHNMVSKQMYSKPGSASPPSFSSSSGTDDLIKAMDQRLQDMEKKFDDLASQIQHIKYALADTGHIEDLKRTLEDTHISLLSVAPRHGFLIFTILGSQALLVVAYFVYKMRRANSPKKYL
jgi:lectin, mannose-binding 1